MFYEADELLTKIIFQSLPDLMVMMTAEVYVSVAMFLQCPHLHLQNGRKVKWIVIENKISFIKK